MRYLTAKQMSEKWGITVRRVQELCKCGEIVGATRHGREWLIPEFSEKPADKRGNKNQGSSPLEQALYTHISVKYKHSGSAKSILSSLNSDEKELFNMQLCYYKGDVKKALDMAKKLMTKDDSFYKRFLLGYIYSLASMALGDIDSFVYAQEYIKEYKTKNNTEAELIDFLLASNASAAYDGSLFPDWFRRGDFAHIPANFQFIARKHYVKYLYIMTHDDACIQHNIPKLEFIRIMPLIIEPLIAQAIFEGNILNEGYLRLMCASAYHTAGEDNLTVKHIEKALDIFLPDGLLLPLAEYRHRLGSLLDAKLLEYDEKVLNEVKKLSKNINSGWIKLHNAVLKRKVSDSLSFREREIAKLAIYGLSNKEIADRLGVSVNAVKLALRSTMDKTGANSRSELYHYV